MDETKPHQLPASAGAGTLIGGRYLLGQLVGRGGVADVYQAEDQLLARSVAIKLFRPDGASMDGASLDGAGLDGAGLDGAGLDGAERHQAEILLLARLNHPGLVAIYDAGVLAADGQLARPYLVMELVIGPSLAERLRRGPLSEQHAVALGGELADALAYIHRREVVHRDVKPANILLGQSEPGSTKLADFGIARASADPRLTGDGLTLGTAQYLSPEQAMGGPVGPASDIYSLGLVLLECLTGEPAFTGPAIEVAVARLHRDPLVPANLDPAIAELLSQMTAREPDARPSAAEVSGQLRPTGTMGPVLDRPTALLPPAAPVPSGGLAARLRSWPVLASAAATVIVLALLAGQLLHRSGPSTDPQVSKPTAPATLSTATRSGAQSPVRVISHPTSASPATSTRPAAPGPKPKKGHPGKHH